MTARTVRFLIPTFLLLLAGLSADAPGTPSIMAVMHKQYTVSRAPFKTLKKEMDAPAPDWDKAREAGERFASLAEALSKNTPLRGTAESWRTHVGRHLADAKAMEQATRDRDPATLRAAHQRIAASCNACHRDHRGRPGG